MGRRIKIAGVRSKHIETALEEEEAALTTVHMAISKQLKRLEVEEQLLREILRQAEAQDPGLARQPQQQEAEQEEEQRREQAAQLEQQQQQQQRKEPPYQRPPGRR